MTTPQESRGTTDEPLRDVVEGGGSHAVTGAWVTRYPCLHRHGRDLAVTGYVATHHCAPSIYARDRRPRVGTRAALPAGMPKSKRTRRVADRAATVDIVSQLECAVRRPQATLIGALIGGLVPWFARTLAHEEVPDAWTAGSHGLALAMIAVVLGCAMFSALTVYKFGKATFGDNRKAIGFTLALEGVMLVSHGATSVAALAVLVLINALGNGATIALARDATCKRRDADARRVASRRNRASRTGSAAAPPAPRPATSAPQPRVAGTPGLVKMPRWNPTSTNDVVDAEIVSEELFS
jgi:hypothetical protein